MGSCAADPLSLPHPDYPCVQVLLPCLAGFWVPLSLYKGAKACRRCIYLPCHVHLKELYTIPSSHRLFTVPYFSVRPYRRCRSFSSTGPPSRSLDASETGERTKCPWVGVVGLIAWGEGAEKIDKYYFFRRPCPPPPLPTGILYSLQFHSHPETEIHIYDRTEKWGTVDSLKT